MRSRVVSYLDGSGIRHTVEVAADSLFEAAVLAMRTFKEHDCEPASLSKLEIEIRSSVTHRSRRLDRSRRFGVGE
jgi:hypothetical protein